ncbi:MAG: signal peptide peptidase SppA [Polyangiaceae bacterium]
MKRHLGRLLTAAALLTVALPTAAQEIVARPTRLPAFGRSVAGTDDSTALVQNPANLAFMPGAEFRWSSVYLDETNRVPWQGHALAFAFPIPFIPVATGMRVDMIDPPRAAAANIFGPSNYQWLTWGLAVGSDTTALGLSVQRSYSDAPYVDQLSSFSLGYSTRPFNALGLSFVAHDVNGPTNGVFGLERSYDLAAAFRPLGTRTVELGLEGKFVDKARDTYWFPRATLGIDIGPLGRLRGDFSYSRFDDSERRAWLASAAFDFYFNGPSGSASLGGGVVTGDGLGKKDSYGVQMDVAPFRGWREPAGMELPRYALRIRIEEGGGARSQVAMLRRLWDIAEEPSVDAVVLELRTAPAGSLAHIQELRDALYLLRQHGKRVLCHLEDASGAELYLCSAANKILINPAGGLRFAGLKTQRIYLKGMLDKLGVHADFVRIGAHKSAPERLTREGASETARADAIDLLQQHERQFVEGVGTGRKIEYAELRKRIAKGPFIASEAKLAGLVDGYAFDDELQDAVNELVGRSTMLIDDERATRAPKRFSNDNRIAVVYVDGDMVDGRSQTIPLLGMKLVGSYTIAETLKKVRENPRIAAVVLRIETGGGSAMASDVIWREVQLTTKVKPVVVSMGAAAASGGYYIASPATHIFANGLSITGSIGIFYGKADVAGLFKKIGLTVETYKTAPRADAESLFRPFSDEEKRELKRKVGQFYDVFLSRVSQGRNMPKTKVDSVGQGRVWTGEQAQARGLVDEIGGLRQALIYARKTAGLPEYADFVELPPPDSSLIGRLLGIEGVNQHELAKATLPKALLDTARSVAPLMIYPADKALARVELVDVSP